MKSNVRFGVFADLHIDIMHDSEQRLQSFLKACDEAEVDFIVQLGDFSNPDTFNDRSSVSTHISADMEKVLPNTPFVDKKKIINLFSRYKKPAYHVLGNHDTDQCSKETALRLFGAEDAFYSFDCHGYHFVVLDCDYYLEGGKYISYDHGNYYDLHEYEPCLPPHELGWLERDLADTALPVIIFSHQSLNNELFGIENFQELRDVFHRTGNKVKMSVNGHNHIDNLVKEDGVLYFNLNSISNQWLGDDFETDRYGKKLDSDYFFLRKVVPYRDPLYAIITADSSFIDIKGTESVFVGKSPYELRYPFNATLCEVTPRVGSYYIQL